MTAVDFILDGLEAALELERELGVRSIEVDRSLLAAPAPKRSVGAGTPPPPPPPPQSPPQPPTSVLPSKSSPPASDRAYPFVFLHDRPLSPGGVAMMAKILAAMGHTVETAPIVVAPPLPKAHIYVVLGGLAMKRYFPSLKGAPGVWTRSETGDEILVTYSPEYLLRFGEVTPAVKTMKKAMWQSLKAVLQKTRLAKP